MEIIGKTLVVAFGLNVLLQCSPGAESKLQAGMPSVVLWHLLAVSAGLLKVKLPQRDLDGLHPVSRIFSA